MFSMNWKSSQNTTCSRENTDWLYFFLLSTCLLILERATKMPFLSFIVFSCRVTSSWWTNSKKRKIVSFRWLLQSWAWYMYAWVPSFVPKMEQSAKQAFLNEVELVSEAVIICGHPTYFVQLNYDFERLSNYKICKITPALKKYIFNVIFLNRSNNRAFQRVTNQVYL